MSHRTYGETRNCAGCRFWSEMIAMADGGEPVKAMCLADGERFSGKYVAAFQTCTGWKSGHYGAVDDPPNYGAEVRPLYEAEDHGAKARGGKR